MYKLLSFMFIISLLSGCSSITPIQNKRKIASVDLVEFESEDLQPVSSGANYITIQSIRPKTQQRAIAEVTKVKSPVLSNGYKREFKLDYHEKLFDFWINYFTKREKALFTRHLKNGEKYKNLVMKIFREHGLPEDLFYLGLIESGFNTKIRSKASAVGPWQFIKGTARRYGLRVDRTIDERYHIHKATHAAARFLKDLYNIFGNWELAMCAYNAGEYRIINAIRKGNTRDYKELVRKKLIPKETIYYIPKIAAAKELERNPSKYGLGHISYSKKTVYNHVVAKTIHHSFSIKKLVKHLKISYGKFKVLNMDLKRNFIRVSSTNPLTLYLPNTRRNRKLTLDYKAYRKVAMVKRSRGLLSKKKTYRVRRGDSLTSIAAAYNVSVKDLKKVNRLKSSKIYKKQRLKIPAVNYKVYRVKKGDNLIRIAKRFKTELWKIVKANALQSRVIYPRQKIIIPL